MNFKTLVLFALVGAVSCASLQSLPSKYQKLNAFLVDNKASAPTAEAFLAANGESLEPEEVEAAKLYGQLMSQQASCDAAYAELLNQVVEDTNMNANPDVLKKFRVHKDVWAKLDAHARACEGTYKTEFEGLGRNDGHYNARLAASYLSYFLIPNYNRFARIDGSTSPVQERREQTVNAMDSMEAVVNAFIITWKSMAGTPKERSAFELTYDEKTGEPTIDREAVEHAVRTFKGYSENFIKTYQEFLERVELDALAGKNSVFYPVLNLYITSLRVLQRYVQLNQEELIDAVYKEAASVLN